MNEQLREFGAISTNTTNRPDRFNMTLDSCPASTTAPVFVLHNYASWIIDAVRKLEAIGKLPENWDSYDGMPLKREAKEMAVRILEQLRHTNMPSPNVGLGSAGTIHLEWRSAGRELEVGLGPDTSVEYVKVNPNGDVEEYVEDARNRSILIHMAKWVNNG